jgi:hypothetical protein
VTADPSVFWLITPATITDIPSVAMTALTLPLVTINPLTRPTVIPITTASPRARMIGVPLERALAPKIAARPATAPTERSHSLVTSGTSAARATTPTTAWLPTRAWMLAAVGKVSAVFE